VNGPKTTRLSEEPPSVLSSIISDIHLWVPTLVLIAGVVVLRWVS
jgi:hypothetical protein